MARLSAAQFVFAGCTAFAWVAWLILMAGVAAITHEWNKISDDLSDSNVAQDAVDLAIHATTGMVWTIVWIMFLVLIIATGAIVISFAVRNKSHFHFLARLLLFILAVLLGWMANECHRVATAERAARDGVPDETSPYSSADEFEGPLGATLAGFILSFLALFGMAFALVFALSYGEPVGVGSGGEGVQMRTNREASEPGVVHNADKHTHGDKHAHVSVAASPDPTKGATPLSAIPLHPVAPQHSGIGQNQHSPAAGIGQNQLPVAHSSTDGQLSPAQAPYAATGTGQSQYATPAQPQWGAQPAGGQQVLPPPAQVGH